MNDSVRPLMNPLVELSDFDSDAGQPMTLCSLPSEREHVRFAVPSPYVDLMRLCDGERTVDEAIDLFLQRNPNAFVRERLQQLVHGSLLPKGLLVQAGQDPSRVAVSSQPRRAFLYIKLPILKPGFVDPVARALGFMFKNFALLLGLLLFIASHVYVYGVLIHSHDVNFNQLGAGGILILMLLSTVGTFFHEFGHASAAAHYGCRRMTIGWGLYLIYTVLWTNVSDAWKLPRRQRAIVDIGGVYFESLFLCLMLLLFLATDNVIFLFAFIFIDLSIAMTFNPFLRMDGYWLMSDLFGIVNLRKQQMIWLEELASRLLGRGNAEPAVKSSLTPRARRVLAIYTMLSLAFLAFILKVIFELVVLNVLIGYPAMVQSYWQQLMEGMAVLEVLGALLELGWRTLLIVGATLMVLGLVKGAVGLFTRLRAIRAAVRDSRVPVN